MITREIEGESYDSFYGRLFNNLGGEHYVSLDLMSGGFSSIEPTSVSYPNIIKEMIHDVKIGRKFLLHLSPGFIEKGDVKVYFVPFPMETQKMLEEMVGGIMNDKFTEDVFLDVKR